MFTIYGQRRSMCLSVCLPTGPSRSNIQWKRSETELRRTEENIRSSRAPTYTYTYAETEVLHVCEIQFWDRSNFRFIYCTPLIPPCPAFPFCRRILTRCLVLFRQYGTDWPTSPAVCVCLQVCRIVFNTTAARPNDTQHENVWKLTITSRHFSPRINKCRIVNNTGIADENNNNYNNYATALFMITRRFSWKKQGKSLLFFFLPGYHYLLIIL